MKETVITYHISPANIEYRICHCNCCHATYTVHCSHTNYCPNCGAKIIRQEAFRNDLQNNIASKP